MLSLMDQMGAKYKACDDSPQRAEEAKALRAQLAELQKAREKELARLKGTDLQGCTLEELTHNWKPLSRAAGRGS